MPYVNKILRLINKNRLQKIDFFVKHPYDVQKMQLKALLNAARNTEWGRKFKYAEVDSIEEYQKRVGIQKYEELTKFIVRIREGEQNILWPTPIKWFAKSSGTTNDKSKFIPVSSESLKLCHYQGGKDVVSLYNKNYPENKLLTGKTLTLGGSYQNDQFNRNSLTGDLSAIMIKNLPFWVNFIRSPIAKIALIPKWEDKLDKLCRITVRQDITALAGVPSWNLVMIKYILEYTGKKHLLEIWPNLELFMHGGVNFSPYLEQFKQVIPSDKMHYIETYNASEGFFAIQDSPSDPGMLLMLDYGIFYEFVPMDQFQTENPKALHIGEVQTGVNYALVLSTNGGLWRYLIGDTIMFTSLFPHKIIVTGRTKHFINAFGEELIIDNADKALLAACKATGALVHEYTAAPVYMKTNVKGRHEWCIEFEREPDSMNEFISVLDQTLMNLNSDYEAKRYNNITLDLPVLSNLKKGTFYRWFRDKGKLGGQNKIPRLSNDRKYAEELLKLNDDI
jgi:GH3 auxin-responsive promoter